MLERGSHENDREVLWPGGRSVRFDSDGQFPCTVRARVVLEPARTRINYQSSLAASWMLRVPLPLVIDPTVVLVMFVFGLPGLK